MIGFPKPSRTATKIAKAKTRAKRVTAEEKAKAEVRRRDGYRCRFPLCGCGRLRLALEVSHQQHKGIGGNPEGDRSKADGMILICRHRHQDGAISRHHGTLRAVALTRDGMNGPVKWEVWAAASLGAKFGRVGYLGRGWVTVATEIAIGRWAPFNERQQKVLEQLGTMEA